MVGDSLSAAYGMEQKKGWVELLRARLLEQRYKHEVVNASVSGETTLGARKRIKDLLAHHKPAIVIVELGANDGLRGLPLRDMQDNMAYIIERAQRAGAKPLLIGMRLPPNYGPAYTNGFHAVYVELAERMRLAFVPFLLAGLEEDRALFQADTIHPTAEAQEILLHNVWPVLKKLLSRDE